MQKMKYQPAVLALDNELGNDLTKIFDCSDKDVMPFMSLFWQQLKQLHNYYDCSGRQSAFWN